MLDFNNQELNVGDIVVSMSRWYQRLVKGPILKIMDKNLVIDTDTEGERRVTGDQVLKIAGAPPTAEEKPKIPEIPK